MAASYSWTAESEADTAMVSQQQPHPPIATYISFFPSSVVQKSDPCCFFCEGSHEFVDKSDATTAFVQKCFNSQIYD